MRMDDNRTPPPLPGFRDTRPRALTVSELTHQVRHLLESSFMQVWIEGELSSFSRPSSGHWYFTLKDRKSQVRCAMFRGANQRIRELPREGDQIRIRGKVTLYESRGDFQIVAEHLEPAGLGPLQQAYEELRNKLQAEGLFNATAKKPLPSLPGHIGIVTSPTGAAIHDILTVLARRCPAIPVTLYPTAVQGKAATADIVRAIERAQAHNVADILIIGRGGGSLEDLWCFNEEAVARAIAACTIPTVSAVGHEVDFTIADFVADLRAPTPSAAAETVSPDQQDWLRQIAKQEYRLANAARQHLKTLDTRLRHLEARLRDPRRELQEKSQRMDELELRLTKAIHRYLERQSVQSSHLGRRLLMQSPSARLADARKSLGLVDERLHHSLRLYLKHQHEVLEHHAHALHLVSPLATLGRGYAIVRDQNGRIVRQATELTEGEQITARVADGSITAKVTQINSGKSQ